MRLVGLHQTQFTLCKLEGTHAPEAVIIAVGIGEVHYVLTWDIVQSHVAVLSEILDEVVTTRHDVVLTHTNEPQMDGEIQLVALDIYEAIAAYELGIGHLFPHLRCGHDGVRLFLKQIVDTLAQSAHVDVEIAFFKILLAVLHRHNAHRVHDEFYGTIDGADRQSHIRTACKDDALLKRAAANLRFWWHRR